ncbi:hypothetical protein VULLAG_LOCUS11066 [Vulpes lagopus]
MQRRLPGFLEGPLQAPCTSRGGGALTYFRPRRPRGAQRCLSASSGFKSGLTCSPKEPETQRNQYSCSTKSHL